MVIAVILNYADSCIEYVKLPEMEYTTENVEDYLVDEIGYHITDISYMIVNEFCPVYDCTEDERATAGVPDYVIK